MDTSTLAPPGQTPPGASCDAAPHAATPASTSEPRPRAGLAAELRESLLLLGFAVGATVGLTTAAQAALALLG